MVIATAPTKDTATEKPPFSVVGYDEMHSVMVVCECDPDNNRGETWWLAQSDSFDFRCTHCGRAHHIELVVQWRPLGTSPLSEPEREGVQREL